MAIIALDVPGSAVPLPRFAAPGFRPRPPGKPARYEERRSQAPIADLGRPLARLVLDNGPLAVALWRRLVRGERATGSLRSGRLPRDAALDSAAGRVAIEAWGSLTPNRYVIGIDEEAGTVLVHELTRSRLPIVLFTDR